MTDEQRIHRREEGGRVMTSDTDNPLGRTYSPSEWAAAKRIGLTIQGGGPLVYATGPDHPDRARRMANDWKLVADAMDREWTATGALSSAGKE